MGPRKRPKPNPKATTEPETKLEEEEDNKSEGQKQDIRESLISGFPKAASANEPPKDSDNEGTETPKSTKSWYGGTWPRGNKAIPVTQVAKESITAAAGAASEAVATARARTPPLPSSPLRTTLGRQISDGPNKPSPLAARTTKINVTSSGGTSTNVEPERGQSNASEDVSPAGKGESLPSESQVPRDKKLKDSTLRANNPPASSDGQITEGLAKNRDSTPWLTWFSKSEQASTPSDSGSKSDNGTKTIGNGSTQKPADELAKTALPKVTSQTEPRPDGELHPKSTESTSDVSQDQRRSWLGLWGNSTTPQKSGSTSSTAGISENALGKVESPTHPPQSNGHKKHQSEPRRQSEAEGLNQSKSSGWAFWSRDTDSKKTGSTTGELALAGSPSQNKPEKDTVDDAKGIPAKVEKRQRPQSMDNADRSSKPEKVPKVAKEPEKADVKKPAPSKPKKARDSETKAHKEPSNLLLPTFKSSYGTTSRSSLIQQLSRWFPFATAFHQPRHLERLNSPHRVKKALAIGVHGFFPAPLVRSFLGQPTGTSLKFANSAASAIQHWTEAQGYSCDIEKVALEGEGKIAERIETLWKLLLNWIDKIRKADFIFVACHSQGCPVALMLIAKLIAFGCVSSANIGVCAMAGVNQGPFIDYKTRWIGATALELFEFARQDSKVSKDYESALDTALKFGVKVVYVGSIDDQLVSLESSTFGTINHPSVYRAVFVDGRVHAPDFLTHLCGFALKLRNLSISDHGLIRELSSPLAGSLYSGEGHSRIYEDEAVYHLAIEHALTTTSVGSIPIQVQGDRTPSNQNPYILPFAMRGLLEEEYVRTELDGEITDLIHQFDDWKPQSKVLKDVKFRLEGVRSKL